MIERAAFAAGCFWGVEADFMEAPGVVSTRVGYTGGDARNPTYKQVCAGGTGHAEAVEVEYDTETTSFEALLKLFFRIHNPTTPYGQGLDVGYQYRSAIFFRTDDQRKAAEAAKQALERKGTWERKVVTQIAPAGTFWPAEEYHQKYYARQGRGNACRVR